MTRVLGTVLTVVFVLAGLQAASAQTPLALTLDDALSRGVGHDPRLAAVRAQATAAGAAVEAQSALRLPSVVASGGTERTNHIPVYGLRQPDGTFKVIFPDIPSSYRLRAEVDMPVYTSGRLPALVDAARADQEAAGATVRSTEEDVRLDIVRAYWGLVTARDNVHVLQQALARADASVADVKARVDAGVLPPNDLLSSQAQRARQSVQLIQAQNAAAIAQVELGMLIGVGPDQPIDPVTSVDTPIAGAADLAQEPAATLVARAREQRAERAGLQDQQAALTASASAALAGTRPQVSAVAAVQPARPNARFVPPVDQWKTSWDLGVNVNWSLWDGGRARADAATATAQREALGHRIDQFDAGVAVEVRQCLLDLQSGRAALAASNEAVAAATEAHRVVVQRFDAGVATSTDVLEAEVALLEAELERTRLTAALRIDEARLLHAVGEL
jgi:outer membrane protein TolC